MRKIRETLRLAAMGLSQHQIARSCAIVQSTVHKYLKLAEAVQLGWPLPEDLSDQKLEELLFGQRTAPPGRRIHPPPDFGAVHKELQAHKNLTLEAVWGEYQRDQPGGYGYSRFCDLYQEWSRAQAVTLRQQHQPGEKLFVDYAGATIPIHDLGTGGVHPAAIFVATLGYSNYTFAEATWSQELPCWIGSHVRAFEYFGGVPRLVVPDNLKAGVRKACRYEPDLNPTYNDMATHYGVAVLPARPRKPRDKAKVENGVQVVQRWIAACLRKRKLVTLAEANMAIGELLVQLNHKPFRKRTELAVAFAGPAANTALTNSPPNRARIMSLASNYFLADDDHLLHNAFDSVVRRWSDRHQLGITNFLRRNPHESLNRPRLKWVHLGPSSSKCQ